MCVVGSIIEYMTPNTEYAELKEMVLENQRFLAEINERLKKQERKQKRDFWLKVIWFFILFIAPMIIFYWYIAPMFSSMSGSSTSLEGSLKNLSEINSLLKNQQ